MKILTLPLLAVAALICSGNFIPSDMKFKMAYMLLGLALGVYWSHAEARNES
jgi:hypothetical protein